MVLSSNAVPGTLTHILLIIAAWFLGLYAYSETRNQIWKSLSFGGVGHKPYAPAPSKPKENSPKPKIYEMARGQYAGTGLTGLSGSIQGTTFLKNNVIRVKRMPNNVRNAFTQLTRGVFSGVSTAWRTLTPTEILSWITQAPLYFSKRVWAIAYQLKGNTLFQRVNNDLTSLGLANVTDAPVVATPQFIITTAVASATAAVPSLAIVLTDFNGGVVLPAGTYMKVYATRQTGVGRSSFSESAYRLIGFAVPADSTNPYNALADYVARFEPLVAGQRIGLAFEVITYLVGPPHQFTASGKIFTSCVVAA